MDILPVHFGSFEQFLDEFFECIKPIIHGHKLLSEQMIVSIIKDTFNKRWKISVDSKCKNCLISLNQLDIREYGDIPKEFVIKAMPYLSKKQSFPRHLENLVPFLSRCSILNFCNMFYGLLKHIPDAYRFQQDVKRRNGIIKHIFGDLFFIIIKYDSFRHRKFYKF